ncbi:hypothetical protein CARUB_v10019767mg [Capsella rubella]|uniref:NB-ARC domain-containing protein n=1 Tax=Capsella rubella TaxID=81985 RepID=R0IAL3_9BRAS|nr:probable disease resistance protein RF45 isoform X1 [Capsella rubella]EOA33618.1 hypothetical protein CARUB_v10019767mg [Capsella rubella]
MATELLSFGIQNLWNLLSHEHKQFQGVEDQVDELKTDLGRLKSFMEDAEAKKHTSARVRNCVEVIKEIIFDAEDILETFILKDQLQKSGGIKERMRRLACIIPERREIALEIGSLSNRISKVIRDMETQGVQKIIGDMRDQQPLPERKEFARQEKSNLVGLEENVEKLVGYLVEEDNDQIVLMTGMGGLGKTTLARQAFHHDKVREKFDRLAWVCVSQVCDRKNVWQNILQSFRTKAEENEIMQMKEERLQDELSRLLETSKSLIVIDDIWKEEDWNLIKPIFPHKKGWKVLLTSRNERVAGREEPFINFKPECLSDEDSWTLFQRIAIPMKDASEPKKVAKEMEEMGRRMLKQCGGLPLAVRVLGGLLAENYTELYWERVSKNIVSHLVGRANDGNNNLLNRVLSLSFEELPGHLKYCFLYLAHFPEDYEISIEELYYYWAAEGIIKYTNGESIRDVGDSYIEELVKRNMVISERVSTTWRFEECRLHDLMRDLCLSKAKEENFLQIVGNSSPSVCTSRRFVSHEPSALHVEREINNSKVRSLIVLKKYIRTGFCEVSCVSFTRLQVLRVLHLPRVTFKGMKLPSGIGKLIHLRYLSLEGAYISYLPSSLRNLKLLIYLNLDVVRRSIFVPNVLKGMKELRYLRLPYAMHMKKKLELSHLVNLETLTNFSTENCSLEDLCGMTMLRTLRIRLTGESSLETLSASIGGARHLETLDIRLIGAAKGTKGWGSLFEFINLQQLSLVINIPLLSDELQFPSSLTSLVLGDCRLEQDPMPILEKFGQLKDVFLIQNSFCGRRMVCSRGGFPQLQSLHFHELDEWEEWIVEEGSMPLLNDLQIWNCKKLKEIPDDVLRSLKDLSFYYMGEEWKNRWSEGGADYYKVKHIPSVYIDE